MPTITTRNADRLQHVAVTRLQLYTAGQVHALLYPFQAWLVKEVSDAGDADGIADAGKLAGVMRSAETRWRAVMQDYVALLTKARQQGGAIAFGPYRLRHNRYITAPIERLQEAFVPAMDDWEKLAEMWLRRRNYALQIAQQHVYSDGLNLSQRIWRLEQGGMQTIRNTIATGMAQRTSAIELAQQLEGQLNAGEDWPRWTRARLSKMDARERAQDTKGLLRSASDVPPGGSAGISYNALRLARNEIQIANHAVTSDIAQNFPGIVGRNVTLSPAHPKLDVCDSLVAENPHPKTANFLPAHPQCLCYFTEALMPPSDFAKQAGAWARGESDFLDGYASWLGQRSFAPIPEPLGIAAAQELFEAMQMWLDGNTDAMATVLKV